MTRLFQSRPQRRAPRANLRGTISGTLKLQNGRQHFAKLHQLSVTGGLLEVANCLEERLWVGLTIYLPSGAVHPTVEMMFPMHGGESYLQPFRIVRISPEELHTLDAEITHQLERSIAASNPAHGPGFRPPRFYLGSF